MFRVTLTDGRRGFAEEIVSSQPPEAYYARIGSNPSSLRVSMPRGYSRPVVYRPFGRPASSMPADPRRARRRNAGICSTWQSWPPASSTRPWGAASACRREPPRPPRRVRARTCGGAGTPSFLDLDRTASWQSGGHAPWPNVHKSGGRVGGTCDVRPARTATRASGCPEHESDPWRLHSREGALSRSQAVRGAPPLA